MLSSCQGGRESLELVPGEIWCPPRVSFRSPIVPNLHRDLGGDLGPDEAKELKYMDDTKIIMGVRTPEEVEDFEESLSKIYSW